MVVVCWNYLLVELTLSLVFQWNRGMLDRSPEQRQICGFLLVLTAEVVTPRQCLRCGWGTLPWRGSGCSPLLGLGTVLLLEGAISGVGGVWADLNLLEAVSFAVWVGREGEEKFKKPFYRK